MNRLTLRIAGPAFLFALALGTSYSGNVFAASCIGSCGSASATDGDITVGPNGSYQWISTSGGATGVGQLPGIPSGTNGSQFTSSPFTALAGAILNYNFNYITSDGSGFPDYGWAQLQTTGGSVVATLLTAQTEPSGPIIPGAPPLPGIDATLNPSSVLITTGSGTQGNGGPGGPVWSPLGGYSGFCWTNPGCGYTGWVNSTYSILADGTYVLVFGVTNQNDTFYDTGLAFSGLTIGGEPIDTSETPLPAALPLFATGLGGLGLLGWRRKRKNAAAIAA